MLQIISPDVDATTGKDQTAADERFMRRALELASNGVGLVSPSPLVGCVLADSSGEIVGEGFYVYDQLKHAEIVALDQAGGRTKDGTAYVTLEPHGYKSRTEPCTEALIRAGIRRVVYAIDDPNPSISGKGGAALRAAGLEVVTGVLALEATRLNEAYLHYQALHRPFVHLKMACSLDGKIASRKGVSQWLTGPEARARVHELRHRSDAILIGVNTALIDDPQLTDRSGLPRRRPLVRVVLDSGLRTPANASLIATAGDAPVLLFTTNATDTDQNDLSRPGVEFIHSAGARIDPLEVLRQLGEREIQSVLIEGGPTIAAAFLAAGLVDKITLLLAPMIMGGADSPTVISNLGVGKSLGDSSLNDIEVHRLGEDIEVTGYTHPPAGH